MSETFQVTRMYRKAHNKSLRGFADWINEKLINTNVTHQTVSRWEHENNFHEPDLRLIFECMATYRDERAEWARDCLRSMFPDLFQSGIIRIKLPKAE